MKMQVIQPLDSTNRRRIYVYYVDNFFQGHVAVICALESSLYFLLFG